MSPEDVFPRWMSKTLRKYFDNALFLQHSLSSGNTIPSRKPRQRIALDAPVVCRPCNTEWMSHIDKLTEPILSPILKTGAKPKTLSDIDCGTLASWMTVKSIVLDSYSFRYHGQRSLFFTQAQCSYVKDKHIPPSYVSVWLGRMTKRGPVTGNARAIHYSDFKAQHLRNLTAFVCTFKFNEVWIQLVARRSKIYGSTLPGAVQFTTQPSLGTWDDYVTEIWPNTPYSTDWPLPRSLGDDSVFNRLAHRLAGSDV